MPPQTIRISKDAVNAVDLSSMVEYVEWSNNRKYFDLEAGQEHYKLLAYIVSQLKDSPKQYIDIGTYFGFSAAAMAMSEDSSVVSYDIYDWIPDDKHTVKKRENIKLCVMDCLDDIDTILHSDFICLDIAHDTFTEQEILTTLKQYKYKGLLFLDDIHLTKEMEEWWNGIDLPKIDLTSIGHYSGTGIVIFDPSRFDIVLE